MESKRWLQRCWTALRGEGISRRVRLARWPQRRLAVERLEGRCVLASGWVNWQEGWPGIETLNPTAPTTSDEINFAFLGGGSGCTDLDLSFDLTNQAIDVVFLQIPDCGDAGSVISGVYGQLEGLDAGVWTLRAYESSFTFTVSPGPPSPPTTFPLMTISNAGVTEGNVGTVIASFTVTLSTTSDQPVTVNYATTNGSPLGAGSDYQAVSGTLTFNPGETSQTIPVPVYGDTSDEFDEIFYVNLRSPTNATLVGGRASGLIWDDDSPPSLTINDVTRAEGNSGSTAFVFTVSLSAASGKTVNVSLAASDGTAQASHNDYVQWGGYRSFAPGETTKIIAVQVAGDTRDEYDETFVVNLMYPENAFIADGQGVGTILDDDSPPALSINDVSLSEGRSGVTYFVFTVSLSAVSDKTISVNFATANGTATSGEDYLATSGTLTFAPGERSKTISVAVKGDNKKEANETFFLNLDAAVNALLADRQGLGTILNDD